MQCDSILPLGCFLTIYYRLKCGPVPHDHGPSGDRDEPSPSPLLQVLVDALSAGIHHVAKIMLCQSNTDLDPIFMVFAIKRRKGEQAFCKPTGQVKKGSIFNDLRGPAQTLTQKFNQVLGQAWLALQQGQKIPAADSQHLTAFDRRRIGRSGPPVKQKGYS